MVTRRALIALTNIITYCGICKQVQTSERRTDSIDKYCHMFVPSTNIRKTHAQIMSDD